jgi:hypothetical protein
MSDHLTSMVLSATGVERSPEGWFLPSRMEDMFEQLRAEIPCDLVPSIAVTTARWIIR